VRSSRDGNNAGVRLRAGRDNIKLASAASDVFGLSSRLMLQASIADKTSLPETAELPKGKLRQLIFSAAAH
jgi:hypothetical protein